MVKGMEELWIWWLLAENIIVAYDAYHRDGESNYEKICSLPLTGVGCVKIRFDQLYSPHGKLARVTAPKDKGLSYYS